MTLEEPEAYELFLILDTFARIRGGDDLVVNHFREKFLPVYVAWHKANPYTCRAVYPLPSRERGGDVGDVGRPSDPAVEA